MINNDILIKDPPAVGSDHNYGNIHFPYDLCNDLITAILGNHMEPVICFTSMLTQYNSFFRNYSTVNPCFVISSWSSLNECKKH